MLTLLISQSITTEKNIFCWQVGRNQLSSRQQQSRDSNRKENSGITRFDSSKITEIENLGLKSEVLEGSLGLIDSDSGSGDIDSKENGQYKGSSIIVSTVAIDEKEMMTPVDDFSSSTTFSEDSQDLSIMSSTITSYDKPQPKETKTTPTTTFLSLPPEIIHQILLHLPPITLYSTSLTCKRLHSQTLTDTLWENILSPLNLSSPHPYLNYRSLHHALSPNLFLHRKIFIGDRHSFGSILVSKYIQETGTIEANSLVVTPPSARIASQWSYDPTALIHTFESKISLRQDPELKISPNSKMSSDGEIPLRCKTQQRTGIFSTFLRAEGLIDKDCYNQMAVWPSRQIPSDQRVRNQSASGFRGGYGSIIGSRGGYFNFSGNSRRKEVFTRLPSNGRLPSTLTTREISGEDDRSEFINSITVQERDNENNVEKWREVDFEKSGFLSEKAFRLRRWTVLGDNSGDLFHRMRMGEQVESFAELDEKLWTPTKEAPFRGIWIGDYHPHPSEFLLFHQPESNLNRLEVIKLTGDPNVPRGEYSFIIDDLSKVLRIADEDEYEWPGARVYKGRGQVSDEEFRNSEFVDIQVIVPDAKRDWEDKRGRRGSTSSSIVDSSISPENNSTETEEIRSNEPGEGWGVGTEERRSSIISTKSKRGKERRMEAEWSDQDWVQRKIAIRWSFIMHMVKMYNRVDVEKFFHQ